MSVRRTRGGPNLWPKDHRVTAREGTFEAHLPRSWSTSSSVSGAFHGIARSRPTTASTQPRNPCVYEGKISSEAVGLHTGFKPLVRQRPASHATIMMRNPCVRDGHVSSEPIGLHTGVPPRRTTDPSIRVSLPECRTGRPRTAPIWQTTIRTSDAIGTHPEPEEPDMNDAAVMHFEAQFAHRFGDHGSVGSVLSRGKITEAAAEFQRRWVKRAEELSEKKVGDFDATANTSVRVDGQRMEKMEFDAVYSNTFTHKDTESAIGKDFVPVIDPRRLTRPKTAQYGQMHTIPTAYGARTPLPTRSVLGIGSGPGRTMDF